MNFMEQGALHLPVADPQECLCTGFAPRIQLQKVHEFERQASTKARLGSMASEEDVVAAGSQKSLIGNEEALLRNNLPRACKRAETHIPQP